MNRRDDSNRSVAVGASYVYGNGLNEPIRPIDLIGSETHWWWLV